MYYYAQPRSAQAHAGFQIEGDGKLHTKPRGFILNYTEAREGKRSERNLANLGPRGPHTMMVGRSGSPIIESSPLQQRCCRGDKMMPSGREAKQPGAGTVFCESRMLGLALLGKVSEVKIGQLNTRLTS